MLDHSRGHLDGVGRLFPQNTGDSLCGLTHNHIGSASHHGEGMDEPAPHPSLRFNLIGLGNLVAPKTREIGLHM